MYQLIVLAALTVCLALPTFAADNVGPIAQLFRVKAKPGHELQLEEGAKAHFEWHRQQGDTWQWETWQLMSGEHYGQFVVRTGFHHWKDFDDHADLSRRDDMDVLARMGDHIESTTVWYTRTRAQSSNLPELDFHFPLINVITYRVKPGKISEFLHVVDEVHRVLQKANWPHHYIWTQLVAGGEIPEFYLILPLDSWSDLEPPAKPVPAVLEEVLGRQGSETLFDLFVSTVDSHRSEILVRRPDLSYTP